MELETAPVAKSEMLIRRPVAEVFEAFVDPAITSRFLVYERKRQARGGQEVQWDWEMYNFSVQVKVKEVEKDKRILVSGAYEEPSTIEWVFTARPDNTTFVSITNSGFTGTGDEIVKKALDSTEKVLVNPVAVSLPIFTSVTAQSCLISFSRSLSFVSATPDILT